MTPRRTERSVQMSGYSIPFRHLGNEPFEVCVARASADLEEEGIEPIWVDREEERCGSVYVDLAASTGIDGGGPAVDDEFRTRRAVERVSAIVGPYGFVPAEEPFKSLTPALPLYVAVNAGCNLKCWYCTEHGENRAFGLPVLSTARLIEILAAAHSAGYNVFRFTGGEPTRRDDLPEIMQAVQDLGDDVQIAITTNGVRLAGMLDALGGLKRRPRVFLSVDGLAGFGEEVGQRTREFRIDKWLTPDLLRLVDELKTVADTRLNYVLTRGSLDQIWDVIELSAEHGVDIKIFELLLRDFIGGGGLSKQEAFKGQYVSIRELIPQLVERFGEPGPFPGLGGRGIPMMSVSTGSSRVIYFDSLVGSHYSERACARCRHFPCQEGLYAPVLNAGGVLHPAGCMNRDLYEDVAHTDRAATVEALNRVRTEIHRSRLKAAVPDSLGLIAAHP